MTTTMRSIFVIALTCAVYAIFKLVFFSGGSAGLAAVSVGISELMVESILVVFILFVTWRMWKFIRHRRQSKHPSAMR